MQITLRNLDPSEDFFGLLSPQLFRDPYPSYHMLRYSAPVYWSPLLGAWLVSRFEDVVSMFHEPRLSNELRRNHGTSRLDEELRAHMRPIDEHLSLWLFNADGERHKRLRAVMARALSGERIAGLRPVIERLAGEVTEDLAGEVEIDFIRRVAQLLPLRVIMHLLSMPAGDLPQAQGWVERIGDFFRHGPASIAVVDAMAATLQEMDQYMAARVELCKDDPPDNLIGDLVRARAAGELVSERELLAHLTMLVFAGHASTADMIGVQLLTLMRNPGHLELVRRQPEVLHRAVREMSRYEGPVLRHDRVASEGFELRGHCIEAGQRVVLMLAGANRDPERFSSPDVLDFDRPDPHTTSFGRGPHACLASRLAHDMAELTLGTFLERFPRMGPGSSAPQWKSHFNFRGLRSLPLRLAR